MSNKVLKMSESINEAIKVTQLKEATFVDAQQMHKDNPKTFWVPSKKELDAIKPGDNVKVCVNDAERFWVLVTKVDGDKITGKVNNYMLLGDYGFDYGDNIIVLKRNVYDIRAKGDKSGAGNESKNFVDLAEKAFLVKSLHEQKELFDAGDFFLGDKFWSGDSVSDIVKQLKKYSKEQEKKYG